MESHTSTRLPLMIKKSENRLNFDILNCHENNCTAPYSRDGMISVRILSRIESNKVLISSMIKVAIMVVSDSSYRVTFGPDCEF